MVSPDLRVEQPPAAQRARAARSAAPATASGAPRRVEPEVRRAVDRRALGQDAPPTRSAPYGWQGRPRRRRRRRGASSSSAGVDVEPDDRAVIPERPAVQRIDDRAAAGRDDRARHRAGLAHRTAPRARGRRPRRGARCTRAPASRCAARRARRGRRTARPSRSATQPADASTCRCPTGRRGRRRQASALASSSWSRASRMTSIGAGARPQLEAPPRLAQERCRHRRAPWRPAARLAHEAGRAGPIDEVEHGEVGSQQVRRDRRLVGVGADRGRVDEQVGGGERAGQVRASARDRRRASAWQPADVQRRQHGPRRAARAEHDGALHDRRQLGRERGQVGVVADQPVPVAHDRVHRAHAVNGSGASSSTSSQTSILCGCVTLAPMLSLVAQRVHLAGKVVPSTSRSS